MLLRKEYDRIEKAEEAWYDSTMIYYTKFVEDANFNKGNLTVIFKTGSGYVYKDVTYQDYFVLIQGGTQSSHGKALNTVIKGKYDCENIGKQDISALEEKYKQLLEKDLIKEHTIYITYSKNMSPEFFDFYYKGQIIEYNDNGLYFLLVNDESEQYKLAHGFLIDTLKLSDDKVMVLNASEFDDVKDCYKEATTKSKYDLVYISHEDSELQKSATECEAINAPLRRLNVII